MSDSGFPELPSSPRNISQIPGRGERSGQQGQIVSASDDIRTEIRAAREARSPARLSGEVIQSRAENIVNIRTQRGDIEIELPARQRHNQNPPQQGQQVKIEIPPQQSGNSQNAIIRPAETQNTTIRAQEQQTTVRPNTTPVNVEITPQTTTPQTTTTATEPALLIPSQNPALQTGDTVQLRPLTAAQLGTITQPILETIQSSIIQPTLLQANLITLDALTQNTAQLLQTAQNITPPTLTLEVLPAAQTQTGATVQNTQAQTPAARFDVLGPETLQTLQTLQTTSITASAIAAQQDPGLTLETRAGLPIYDQEDTNLERILAHIRETEGPRAILAPPQSTAEQSRALNAPAQAIANNQQAGIITGVISGITGDNVPVLSIFAPNAPGSTQLFALPAPAHNITLGTQVHLSPQTNITAQTINTSLSVPPSAATLLTPEPWPLLQNIQESLLQTAPQIAQSLSNVTPSPSNPAQMSPAAMFFMAAIRVGDLSSWLGDKALDVLRKDGKQNLISRLSQEGGILSRLSAEGPSQDWRALTLPMMWDNQIHKISLHYKQERGDENNKDQKGGFSRFVMDLNLDNIGSLQLDGLFRGQKMDLVVRTENSFSSSMRMEMRAIYVNALEQSGLSGELSFQNKPEQWVRVNTQEEGFGASA